MCPVKHHEVCFVLDTRILETPTYVNPGFINILSLINISKHISISLDQNILKNNSFFHSLPLLAWLPSAPSTSLEADQNLNN